MMVYSICEETGLLVCELFPLLLVREDGLVKNINPSKYAHRSYGWNRGTASPDGYYHIGIPKINKQMQVHRLVLLAFSNTIKDKPLCDHINGIVGDNNISNLRWVNHAENMLNNKKSRSGKQSYIHYSNTKKKWVAVKFCNKKAEVYKLFETEFDASNFMSNYLKNKSPST